MPEVVLTSHQFHMVIKQLGHLPQMCQKKMHSKLSEKTLLPQQCSPMVYNSKNLKVTFCLASLNILKSIYKNS